VRPAACAWEVFRRVPPCVMCVPGRRGRHADAPGTRPARSYSPPRAGKAVTSSRARSETARCGSRADGRRGAGRAAPPRSTPRGCTRGCALAAPLPIASLRRVEVRAAERTERGETAPRKRNRTGDASPKINFQTHVQMYSRAHKTICHGVCKFRVQPQDRRWSCTSMSGCPPRQPRRLGAFAPSRCSP
jgi:hypothetical protein